MDTSGNIRYLPPEEEPKFNEIVLSDEQAMELARHSKSKRKKLDEKQAMSVWFWQENEALLLV